MRHAMILAGLAVLVLAAPCAVGCFDYSSDCELNPALSCFWDGAGGSGGTGGSSPECVPSATNKNIDETCGKFVSADGSDANGDGSKEKPFLTVAHAVEVAIAKGESVYACADPTKPFDEVVEPTGEVAIYGGFVGCDKAWTYDATKKSALTAPADEVPLVVGGDAKVSVFDFTVTARDAVKAGGSSIAVLAFGETAALVMERCDLVAGNGKAGEAGVTPTAIGPNGEGQPGGKGEDGKGGDMAGVALCAATGYLGGAAGQNTCGVDLDDFGGGLGGAGTNAPAGDDGNDGNPAPAGIDMPGSGGKGEDSVNGCGTGVTGANGMAGITGGGAAAVGDISESGYSGASGIDGKSSGTPGQGGGGGGGAKKCAAGTNAGPSGGGGGAGGCGGLPGTGGKAGGVSFGLVSVNASVTLIEVGITTATGGDGGPGADGQKGGSGGGNGQAGGAGACAGGAGGQGGPGGGGGGGRGGHSAGIASKGTAPTRDKVTITTGTAGLGGLGGNGIAGANGAPGHECKSLNYDDQANPCGT